MKSHHHAETAAQNVGGHRPPTVSARKRASNRNNAKKSTGPTTARGKANSRFNALKHGLCAKRILSCPHHELLDQSLLKLLEDLQEQYGRDDILVQLLLESIVTDYWRQARGLKFEVQFLNESDVHFGPQGGMTNLQRYMSGSQRALLKHFEMLEKLRPQLSPSPQAASNIPDTGNARSSRETTLHPVPGNGSAIPGPPNRSKHGSPSLEPVAGDPASAPALDVHNPKVA
ncbi:MAG: hypothetical protein LAO09_04670 [Acidobacteriia bacterium]|nr:hypothetical protein [Terriglobia bacterium]